MRCVCGDGSIVKSFFYFLEDTPSVQILINGGIKSMNQMKETLGYTPYIVQSNTDDETYVFKPLMPVVVVKDSGRCKVIKLRTWHKFKIYKIVVEIIS